MSRGSIDIPVISKFDPTGIKQAQGALKGFGKSLLSVGALVAGAFAIRGIVNFGMESVLAAERAQQFNSILTQVAKTTGVFGADVEAATSRMIKFADSHELVIGVEAELIKEAQGVLLSFKAVGKSGDEVGGVFDRATKAAFDMAAVLKTDARGSAVQLGKALENPIKGVTALAKAGTTFTDQQREQIKVLVESGNLLAAQELILTEVESQYGGAAEAAALSSEKIKLAFGQVQDALGEALAPAFERFATFFITEVVPPLTKFFEEDFPRILGELQPIVEGAEIFFNRIGDAIKRVFDIDEDTSLIEGLLAKFSELGDNPEFVTFVTTVADIFEEMLPDLTDIVFQLGELAAKLVPIVLGALQEVLPSLANLASILDDAAFFLGELVGMFGDFEVETPSFLKAIEMQLNPMARLAGVLDAAARAMKFLREEYEKFIGRGGINSLDVSKIRTNTIGGRADGGRVTGGVPYLVGEMGPELFMPGRGGNIVPNDMLGRGGGSNITINVNAGMGTDGARVGEQIVNAIRRYERSSGPVFAKA